MTVATIAKILPNILTVLACCAGLIAIMLAADGGYQGAVLFLLAAAVLDMLDGRTARKLGVDSQFGVELDSLADVISFGVAPGLILYHWLAYNLDGQFGWVVVLVMGVCAALRLARFNAEKIADEHDEPALALAEETGAASPDHGSGATCFSGLAAPSGAVLAMLPVIISFGIWPDLIEQSWIQLAVPAWVILIGLLMVSHVPTFSFKGTKSEKKARMQLVLAVAVLAAFVVKPWVTLVVMSALYMLSIPLACWQHRHGND